MAGSLRKRGWREERALSVQRELEDAHRDAMKHIASDVPDPRDYAAYGMRLETRSALLTASFDSIEHAWKVQPDIAKYLRPFGLVGYGTVYLTAFGTKVFKALRRIEQ